jgi:hypothetical protein
MAATKITIRDNGSVRIEGDFEIVDAQGKPFGLAGRTNVALCRCGHSQKKPFCDWVITSRACNVFTHTASLDGIRIESRT